MVDCTPRALPSEGRFERNASPPLLSILIPTFNRPNYLHEAVGSLAGLADMVSLEILIGDDSDRPEMIARNRSVAAEFAHLPITLHQNRPSLGNYANQVDLGKRARGQLLLILHDDDRIIPEGAMELLMAALRDLHDPTIAIWFGRNRIIDAAGNFLPLESLLATRRYGKSGPSALASMTDWSLAHALPPNSFLIRSSLYQEFAWGPRDGNVGDIWLSIRLANAGFLGRFIGVDVSDYRLSEESVTGRGRGMDVHLMLEAYCQLRVSSVDIERVRATLRSIAGVATRRYLRHDEYRRAALSLQYWSVNEFLSLKGVGTLFWAVGLFMKRAIASLFHDYSERDAQLLDGRSKSADHRQDRAST